MPLTIACQACGGTSQVPDKSEGYRGKCPFCGALVQVPVLKKKYCSLCKTDISSARRVKDSRGNYFCEPCYNDRVKAQRIAAGEAMIVAVALDDVPAPPASPASLPPVAALMDDHANDNIIALADEPAPGPSPAAGKTGPAAQEAMAACADCRKILPRKQVQLLDDEFICLACAAKRAKVIGYQQPAPENLDPAVRAAKQKEWIRLGLTILACIGISFIYYAVLEHILGLHSRQAFSPLMQILIGIIVGILRTIELGVFVGVLMFSMLMAGKIFGGLEFGSLASSIVKCSIISSIVLTFLIVSSHFPAMGWVLAILPLMAPIIAVAFSLVIAFRLEYIEALVASAINFFLTMLLYIIFNMVF